MPSGEFDDFASAVLIMLAVVGMLILFIAPRSEERFWRLGLAFFVGGLGGTVGLFLIGSPDVLADVREHIGLTLLGMVIATLSIIRVLKK